MTQKRRSPHGAGNVAQAGGLSAWQVYSKPRGGEARVPANWRDRLPDPESYYRAHVAKLGKVNATGWAQGACPFHDDRNASLSVNLRDERGGWRCFAGCGGGDLVGFHMRQTGKPFKEAVTELLGVRA